MSVLQLGTKHFFLSDQHFCMQACLERICLLYLLTQHLTGFQCKNHFKDLKSVMRCFWLLFFFNYYSIKSLCFFFLSKRLLYRCYSVCKRRQNYTWVKSKSLSDTPWCQSIKAISLPASQHTAWWSEQHSTEWATFVMCVCVCVMVFVIKFVTKKLKATKTMDVYRRLSLSNCRAALIKPTGK